MATRKVTGGSGGNPMLMGGDNSGYSYVSGEHLKQVSVPVETLIGTANAALSGAVISSGISAAITAGSEFSKGSAAREIPRQIFAKLTGTHLLGVLAGTGAIAMLGGLIRYSRAAKHNEWSDKYYELLSQEQTSQGASHAERVETRGATPDDTAPAR